MGWAQHLSTSCPVRVGSCGYVPSCQAPKAAAFRGPRHVNAYPLLKAPRRIWSEAPVLPRVEEGGWMARQVVKSCMDVPIVGWKSESVDYYRD
jgi:hypothetical protein